MNKICRICLEGGVLSSVFTKDYNLSISGMIEYCCNIKINRDDGLPEQLCSNCLYKLGIAYHFKQTCESSDVRLKQYLGLSAINKFNEVSTMTDPVVSHPIVIKKCKCKLTKSQRRTNYKRKAEGEKLKRGPKPKPKQEHSCYQCHKQFRCQTQLEMHERTHTGEKPFPCMYCPRRFTQKHNLTIHLRTHTGEKPFQCDVCSKRFCAQGNLFAHLKIHTGQKDHSCTVCSKAFITSSELTRHMTKHSGLKSFKCDLCGCSYISARNLKLHKLNKHRNPSQKTQNEGYSNSNHIDICGIDVGKETSTMQVKDVSHQLPHVMSDKPPNLSNKQGPIHVLLPYNQKTNKDIFSHYYEKAELHNCAICGEGFDYLNALAQHHLHHHKDYDSTLGKSYGS